MFPEDRPEGERLAGPWGGRKAESSVTLLTAERLLLGVGPLVSAQRGVVGELPEADITAVGLLASVDPLVDPQV